MKREKKKPSHPECLSNLRNGVGFCLEGSNKAIGISQDKNILIDDSNPCSCESECNILPAPFMCFLGSNSVCLFREIKNISDK